MIYLNSSAAAKQKKGPEKGGGSPRALPSSFGTLDSVRMRLDVRRSMWRMSTNSRRHRRNSVPILLPPFMPSPRSATPARTSIARWRAGPSRRPRVKPCQRARRGPQGVQPVGATREEIKTDEVEQTAALLICRHSATSRLRKEQSATADVAARGDQ